jgi:septal ring factor EnvC (AmiA/AmiB activator)
LQINNLSSIRNSQESNISKIIERDKSTSSIIGMIKSADLQITNLSKKIDSLSISNNTLFQQIDNVKNENIGLEQQVGGFRFVAEAFGVELKKAVKYFILLIVFVFDPLAIALVLAFNNKILQEPKIEEILPIEKKNLTKKKRTRGRPK